MKLGLMPGYSDAELRIPLEGVQLAERLGYDSGLTGLNINGNAQAIKTMAEMARLNLADD